MSRIIALFAATLSLVAPGLAYDAGSQALVDRFKVGKLVRPADLATLMMGAERWCYNQQGYDCGWSDIYLSADADGASYELTNPWSESIDISFVDRGEFRNERYFCEMGMDWVPSLRAFGRADGLAIEGRDLAALRDEIAVLVQAEDSSDCFDYIYRGHDAAEQTITLLQRQFVGGVHAQDRDATVTLHFDKLKADNLGWYW